MADKRISQLVDRGTVANNDVVPIVVSGATTTNKATISSIQTYMQGNLDLGVTSVGITLGSSGTDVSVSGSPITSSGNITINLPTASATNRGLLSAADWVTFNSKQDAGSFVTLDTVQTITAQKTFTTSGSSDTMIISHGSGSGFALDVLKAGNNEALRVTKTSGSGNAMTVIGGNFEAPTIVKTGGTSTQFLKADGSVDSNTYLTTGSATSTYVPYSGAAASVNLGVYSITANAINSAGSGSTAGQINLRSDAFFSLVNGYGSIASGTTNQFNLYQTTGAGVFRGAILSLNSITESATRTYTLPDASGTLALTTDLSGYLPLTGGTLSNNLFITGGGLQVSGSTSANRQVVELYTSGSVSRLAASYVGSSSYGDLELLTGGLARLTISAAGATTLTGALNGTSANFSGDVTASSNAFFGTFNGNDKYHFEPFTNAAGGANNAYLVSGKIDNNERSGFVFQARNSNGDEYNALIVEGYNSTSTTPALTLSSTGAATFSSSVGTKALSSTTSGAGNLTAYIGNSVTSASGSTGYGLAIESEASAATSYALTVRNLAGSNTYFHVSTETGKVGNVGIGTASPGRLLTLYKSSTPILQFVDDATGTGASNGFLIYNGGVNAYLENTSNGFMSFQTAGSERMRITSVGNTQPGADNAYSLGVSGTRWSAVWAANGTIQTSDEREKKDIIDSDLGLDFVNQLRPVSFKWKVGQNVVTSEVVKDEEGNPILDEEGNEKTESVTIPREGKRTHYGLIAQEVEKLLDGKDFGGFIHDEETDIKGLRYDQFVPLLIKSIQELSQKIVILESKLK